MAAPAAAPFAHSKGYDAAALEAGRLLFAGPCDFVKGVVALDGLPTVGLPELAFAGRSNVGKSSLVNALTGRKTLAKTSNTPGRTQEINFFDLGGRAHLVDMPGYGFAEAPKERVQAWNALVRDYLRGRRELKRVFVLIDGRHGPKAIDEEVMDMLDKAAAAYQVVLTKLDKLKPAEVEGRIAETAAAIAKRPAAHPVLMPTSAEKGWGVPELRAEMAGLVAF